MATYERALRGGFDEVLSLCESAVMEGSMTASAEGWSDFTLGTVRVAVRVFERYSAFGGNRVSLNLTLAGDGDTLFLSAITAGGSQATFFKINTLGEESFLDTLIYALEERFPC